jgi:hypothetical protein
MSDSFNDDLFLFLLSALDLELIYKLKKFYFTLFTDYAMIFYFNKT